MAKHQPKATFRPPPRDDWPKNTAYGMLYCHREPSIEMRNLGFFPVFNPSDVYYNDETYCYKIRIVEEGKRLIFAARSDVNEVWITGSNFDFVYRMEGEHSVAFCLVMAFYGYTVVDDMRGPIKKKFLLPFVNLESNWNKRMSFYKPTNPRFLKRTRPGLLHYKMIHKLFGHLQRFIKIRNVDREFVNAEIKPCQMAAPCEEVDEGVYQRFKAYMNLSRKDVGQGFSGRASHKMHGIRFTELPRIYKAWSKKEHIPWDSIDGSFTYAARPRALKKDGTVRNVFVMSPKLNAFITQRYGQQEPRLPPNCKLVKGYFPVIPKHSYDVKSCDRLLLPYFRRLLQELYPDDEDKILCKVIHEGRFYDLPQFPSGVCVFMAYITSVFTCALLDLESYGCDVYVQGDGVVMDLPLRDLTHVREYPKGVVNGFSYLDGIPRYINAREKLSTPIFYDPFKFHGLKKWEFRRAIYIKVLNALDVPDVRDEALAEKFGAMSGTELLALSAEEDPEIADWVLRWSCGGFGTGNGTTWHGIPTIGFVY